MAPILNNCNFNEEGPQDPQQVLYFYALIFSNMQIKEMITENPARFESTELNAPFTDPETVPTSCEGLIN